MTRRRSTTFYFPAQIRYQERNPVVSFRIPFQEHTELKEKAKKSGISLAELARKNLREASNTKEAHEKGFQEGFETAKREFETTKREFETTKREFETAKREFEKSVKEAHERGFDKGVKIEREGLKKRLEKAFKQGYEEGIKDTRSKFEIKYPCAVCGEMMTMHPNQRDHKAMQELMVQNGWKHVECEE